MNLKAYTTLVGALIITLQFLYGQSSFIPKNMGPSVNSTYDEINPVISPDGKTLYFIRVNHPDNNSSTEESEEIWYCELQPDGTWSKAQRDKTLNVSQYNSILSISPDGSTALITGVFNNDGTIWKRKGLSICKKAKEGWGIPQELKVPKLSTYNLGLKSSGMMSNDGKFIVLSLSRSQNGKRNNLFFCVQNDDGTYSQPFLINALKAKQISNEAPFLQADNKTLYFSCDQEEEGQFDIYKTIRQSDDWELWSEPEKLNDTINSSGWESYFKTNIKGSWAYYSSSEKSIGGADIYKIKLFEENPFVVVSGKILHAQNNKPLVGKKINVSIKGIPADSIHINADSATYSVRLPLGKLYTFATAVKHYKPGATTLDVTAVKEFTLMKKDLLAEPMPYVLVTGRMLDRNSNQLIPADANPKITIEGIAQDSIQIDANAGTYKAMVKYGKVYKVNLTANRYEPLPNTIDVTNEEEYREVPLDVFVDREKAAVVLGKIMDKKTNKPIDKSIHVSIRVEGMTTVWATIDSVAGTYDLKLPLGANYTISASAPNYYPLYETLSVGKESSDVKIYKDLTIVPIEVGQSIRLNNIFFEVAKSKLKPESFAELDRVADFLKSNPEIKIEIGGHTDNAGKAASNMKLSQARAAAVADYIISKGLPKEKIVSKGYGLTKPVATNKTKEGKAQNRRVEFTILDK
jgi:outer membrane protein OmpA-like peptidoglycan-associated protein